VEKFKNLFITFEGGEGAGKSSVAILVKTKLEEMDKNIFMTREPGGKGLAIAEDIRKIIMNHGDVDPVTELLLFSASRKEHMVKKIIPALENGEVVISDRFTDSTLVYQGLVKGVDKETIQKANDIATGGIYPDLTFIFDLDPKIGMERIAENQRETNRFDVNGINFHKAIRQAYLDLAESNRERYKVIDASKTKEEVANEIVEIIKNHGN
jgi:dTMP kinase